MAFSIDNVKDTMVTMVDTMQNNLADAITAAQADPSNTAAMFELQYQMQRWTVGVETESNSIKTLGDTLKSVVSNLR